MDQQLLDRLQFKTQQADIIRSWCQHAGFKLFQALIKERQDKLQATWFNASDEEALRIKLRAQVYQEVLDAIKACLIAGDAARQTIKRHQDDLDEQQ